MDIKKNELPLVDCQTVTKYSAIFFPNFNKYFVEFMQKQRSNIIFQYINVCPVPWEMLKTSAYGLGFQHLPRDLANVNAWKTMFDLYIDSRCCIIACLFDDAVELIKITVFI